MAFNAFPNLFKNGQPVAPTVIRLPIPFNEFYRRVLHDRDAKEFDNFAILQIAIHKSTGSMQHECIVVKFTDRRRPPPTHGAWPSWYCSVERAGPDGRGVRLRDMFRLDEGNAGVKDELLFASSLDDLFGDRPEMQHRPEAYATFTATSRSPNVLDYTFSPVNPTTQGAYTPTLRHLARVVLAFHRTSPDYSMNAANCYAFAHSVFHLMVDLFPPLGLMVGDGAAGTWRSLPVRDLKLYEKSKVTHATMDTRDFCEVKERELEAARHAGIAFSTASESNASLYTPAPFRTPTPLHTPLLISLPPPPFHGSPSSAALTVPARIQDAAMPTQSAAPKAFGDHSPLKTPQSESNTDVGYLDKFQTLPHRNTPLRVESPETQAPTQFRTLQESLIYASTLANRGLYPEARNIMHEVVKQQQKLFATDPNKYRPELATSLHRLGHYTSGLELYAEARDAALEAVQLMRSLYDADPATYRAQLADYLDDLGRYLAQLKQNVPAQEALLEATNLWRELDASDSNKHRAKLVGSLYSLSASHRRLEETAEASNLDEEANALLDGMPLLRQYWEQKVGSGSYGTVYRADWLQDPDKSTRKGLLAVKILRVEYVPSEISVSFDTQPDTRRVHHELLASYRLLIAEHLNVVKVIGYVAGDGGFGLVTSFYANGSVTKYLANFPNADRESLCRDVISGIHHLHTLLEPLVHGAIKPNNVLVDEYGRAALCDIALSSLTYDTTITDLDAASTSQRPSSGQSVHHREHDRGTLRYLAYELVIVKYGKPTFESDMYALACTCAEILSGIRPFADIDDSQLYVALSRKESPYSEEVFRDKVPEFALLADLWNAEPSMRLSIRELFDSLSDDETKIDKGKQVGGLHVARSLATEDVHAQEREKETRRRGISERNRPTLLSTFGDNGSLHPEIPQFSNDSYSGGTSPSEAQSRPPPSTSPSTFLSTGAQPIATPRPTRHIETPESIFNLSPGSTTLAVTLSSNPSTSAIRTWSDDSQKQAVAVAFRSNRTRNVTNEVAHQLGNLIFGGIPSLYSGRVNRLLKKLHQMDKVTIKRWLEIDSDWDDSSNLWHQELVGITKGDLRKLKRFKHSWEELINSFLNEWQTLNYISVLLLPAILTVLQMDGGKDPGTRTLALSSLALSLTSLIYECIYTLRFQMMRSMQKAFLWVEDAQKGTSNILWNVWIFLALPSIFLFWTLISFIACILAFVMNTGTADPPEHLTKQQALVAKVLVPFIITIELLWLVPILKKFRFYSQEPEVSSSVEIETVESEGGSATVKGTESTLRGAGLIETREGGSSIHDGTDGIPLPVITRVPTRHSSRA